MGPVRYVAFGFVIFAAFGAGYYYNEFSTVVPFAAHAKVQEKAYRSDTAVSPVASEGDYCAILHVPKAYVPLIERFKRNKLAKEVTITPATIENENGRITAVAKNDAMEEKIARQGVGDASQDEWSSGDKKDNSIFGALAVYFLAGSKRQETP